MLDESNGINSDLSYLQSKVSDYFDKIFFNLEKNFSEDKQQFGIYFVGLMNAILNNEFSNKEQILKELSGLHHGPALSEAVDETDKILNDNRKSHLFTDLKTRLKVLKGGIIADDDTISGFIKKHSKPYLEELFKEKQNILQQENPQEDSSSKKPSKSFKDELQKNLSRLNGEQAKEALRIFVEKTEEHFGPEATQRIYDESVLEATKGRVEEIKGKSKIDSEGGLSSDESEKTTPPKATKIESATSVSPKETQQYKS